MDTEIKVMTRDEFMKSNEHCKELARAATNERAKLNAIVAPVLHRYMLIVSMDPEKKWYEADLIRAITYHQEIGDFDNWSILEGDMIEWFYHYHDYGSYEEGSFQLPLQYVLEPALMDKFEAEVNERIRAKQLGSKEEADRKAAQEKAKRFADYQRLRSEFEP